MEDKIIIKNNVFIVCGLENIRIKFNTDEELFVILTEYFNNNKYRTILVSKRVEKRKTKVGIFTNDLYVFDAEIITAKSKLGLIKSVLIGMDYQLIRPSNYKNNQKVLTQSLKIK